MSAPLTHLLDTYATAAYHQDLDTMLGLYADDVRVFDAWGEFCYQGKDAWRPVLEHWFTTLGTERCGVSYDGVVTIETEDLCSASMFLTYTGFDEHGQQLRQMTHRMTWTLRREGEGWVVVHEHTSAPAGDDGQVILQR